MNLQTCHAERVVKLEKRSRRAAFSIGIACCLIGSGVGLAGCGAPATEQDPVQQETQDLERGGPNLCRIFSCVDQVVDCKSQPSCHECTGDVLAIECCNPYNRSCTVINKPKLVVRVPIGDISGTLK